MDSKHDLNIRNEDAVIKLLEHEAAVTNHRVVWMAAFHGLLLTALGFLWDKKDAKSVISILCALGIIASVLSSISLIMSSLAVQKILIWWDAKKPHDYAGPGVIGLAPRNVKSSNYFFAPWNLLSIAFILAWSAIFIINYGR